MKIEMKNTILAKIEKNQEFIIVLEANFDGILVLPTFKKAIKKPFKCNEGCQRLEESRRSLKVQECRLKCDNLILESRRKKCQN